VPEASILIRGGRLLDPASGLDAEGDLLLEDGRIATIAEPGKIPASKGRVVIDAGGQWVLPGLIDAHVHLREPGFEYKETIATGTRAAVAGGFTSVACMANTDPVNDSPEVTAFIRERARADGACRVFPIGAVSKGLKGEELAEIGSMVAEGAVAASDDGMPVMNAYLMRKALEYARAFAIPVITHAEDRCLVAGGVVNEGAVSTELGLRGNPAAAEEIMVARDISLCRLARGRLHVAHVSTRAAVDLVRRAKQDGISVTAEVTPHHLMLTERHLHGYDAAFKMAPPLRTEEDVRAVREALADGTVDLLATDHAPHGIDDKSCEFELAAFGVVGIQTAVPVTLELVREGKLPLKRWVESLTSAPAKLLGIPHGRLREGIEADVTLVDPEATWTLSEGDLLSKSRNSPFIGRTLKGRVTATLVNGAIAYRLEGRRG